MPLKVGAKCRFVNARPEPDFRYFSKRTAVRSSGNSIETRIDQGRCEMVHPLGPSLCHRNRSRRSFVIPM